METLYRIWSKQVYHKGWHAEFEVVYDRAIGKLFDHNIFVRDFDVQVRKKHFSVDIGACNRVKVKFEIS
jgi:hypothetical protein